MKTITLLFTTFIFVSCSPLIENLQENRLKFTQSFLKNQHELIVESINAKSSSEAIIAADLLAIKKCSKTDQIPKIESRQISPKHESADKKVTQSYLCIDGNDILKKRVAGLKKFHCRFHQKRKELNSICNQIDS